MISFIWKLTVTGTKFDLFWWSAFTAYSMAGERWKLAGLYAVLLLLNAYSYDYQRRHGGAS